MRPAPAYDTEYFNQAQNTFQQAAQNALPSAQLRDTAASRIRARMAGAQNAQNQSLQDAYASRGRANSGAFQGDLLRSNAAGQSALATGLADNEANYLKAQQEGANILKGIGEGQASLGIAKNKALTDFGQLNIDDSRQRADEAFQTGTLDENATRRKFETALEGLKTFGQYGNVSGQQQYSAFANALRSLFGQAGIDVPDFSTGAPPPTGGGITPSATTPPPGGYKAGYAPPKGADGSQGVLPQLSSDLAWGQGPNGWTVVPKHPNGYTYYYDANNVLQLRKN